MTRRLAGAGVLPLAASLLAGACGGGSTTSTSFVASGEGITSRTPPAISGLAAPVTSDSGCVATYVVEVIGHDRATAAPRLLLTMTLRTSPASEADLAATLDDPACVSQRQDILKRATTSLPTGGGGGLDIGYRSASGARLLLP